MEYLKTSYHQGDDLPDGWEVELCDGGITVDAPIAFRATSPEVAADIGRGLWGDELLVLIENED